ncbi:Rho guanine nucleotide exchange factor 4 [Apophysomyces ossiformis]|uniref:Rho guanine nucleotide exchange factor 4 n=1 Tax=Apophysomyces ossiformis TaxID=679940 RepID=A0A8H7BSA5_9FUNG|nr:Rho guanine nucleotide exchange factor 4 [Apophysomyces ossiformis]
MESSSSLDHIDIIDELYEFFNQQLNLQSNIEDTIRKQIIWFMIDLHQRFIAGIVVDHRELIVHKLLSSESDYIQQLKLALNEYKGPLMDSAAAANRSSRFSSSSNRGSVTTAQIESMFGNMETLLAISHDFHDSLTERIHIWGPTQLLSDLLVPFVTQVDEHYRTYFRNYANALAILERLSRCQQMKTHVEDGRLISFIEQPLHAFERYKESLRKLIMYTEPQHPDAHRLYGCVSDMEQLVLDTQRIVRKCHNMGQLFRLTQSIRHGPPLLDKPRQLILSGELYFGRSQPRTCLLLSDTFIYCKKSSSRDGMLDYKGRLDLNCVSIKVYPHGFKITKDDSEPMYKYSDDVNALLIASGGAPPRSYYLFTTTAKDHALWLHAFQKKISPKRLTHGSF